MELYYSKMKRILTILLLFIGLSSFNQDTTFHYLKQNGKYLKTTGKYLVKYPASDTVFIIGILGQSNAVGEAGDQSTLYPPYQGSQQYIYIAYDGNYITYPQPAHLENMLPCTNTRHRDYTNPTNEYYYSCGWSAEQRCAHRLQVYKNSYVAVIKSAYGGVSQAWFFDTNEGMQDFILFFNAAISDIISWGKIPKFKSIIWLQGESNCVTPDNYYEGNMEYIINYIRTYSSYLANVNFTMVKLSPKLARPTANKNIINNAFVTAAAAKGNCFIIDPTTVGATLGTDSLHFTANSLNILGETWFNLIK